MASAKIVSLIQGASRGIGLQYCRHLLTKRNDCFVVATCRDPSSAFGLQSLHNEYGDRLSIIQMDVTKDETIVAAADDVKKAHDHLDLLINAAGILHPSGKGETSLREVTRKGLEETLATNAIGPLLVAKHFAPLLQKGSGAFGKSSVKNKHTAVIANISAKVGSITDNGLGGWYSYRMAKCALNMATKNLSIELGRGKRKVICITIHPGTVNTDLSRPYHKGVPEGKLFSPEYSVQCQMNIINNLDERMTGKFFSWDGTELLY